MSRIGIDEKFGDDEYECSKGHLMKRSDLECECGLARGQGNFDFNANIDPERLNAPVSEVLGDDMVGEISDRLMRSAAFDGYLIQEKALNMHNNNLPNIDWMPKIMMVRRESQPSG